MANANIVGISLSKVCLFLHIVIILHVYYQFYHVESSLKKMFNHFGESSGYVYKVSINNTNTK